MAIEEEIKLTADSVATLDAIATDPLVLAYTQGQPVKLRSYLATYYDTPERQLLNHQLAFRMRQEGSGLLRANLKGTGGMEAGLSRRQEWEETLLAPVQRLGELPAGELREQVLAVADSDTPLVPLLVTDFKRRILLLHWEGSRGEMALDQGEVRAGGRVHPLCEVELERLEGSIAPLQALTADLMQRYPLRPSQRSKFGLGLSLLGLDRDI
ncbi:MAG: CYTH domain-containing protein [Magnetococcales bacterium]|nr:CYTH domain-containing protein [Magnetococcales bacterium]